MVRPATTALLVALMAPWAFIGAGTATAETAWVRGEVRLNVRTGPGTKFRIIGNLKTGDQVQIRKRAEDWIQVAPKDGTSGWIPQGYLKPKPPAALLLAQLEVESAALREASASATQELTELKESNAVLTLQDGEQRLEIDQLRRENIRLKARARWPEWITGSAIVCAGMIVGAILQRSSGRRTSTRIRL